MPESAPHAHVYPGQTNVNFGHMIIVRNSTYDLAHHAQATQKHINFTANIAAAQL